MDFGIGFLSNNIMLPILDFFYGVVPSYGLAIVALTLVIRFALYPLNAGSIRNMRKMKVANPIMQKRMAEIKERYKDDPVKQQEEIKGIYGEFGNPLAGCFPVVLQMPILFALFATLRGSPFADITLPVNLKIVPEAAIEQVQDPLLTKPSNIFVADGEHFQVSALVPTGSQLAVGDTTQIELRSVDNKSLDELRVEYAEEGVNIAPTWEVTKGQELVAVQPDGTIKAIAPGDVTVQAKVPGLAADKGFLFIEKLGRIGVTGDNGEIHWDILGMIIFFGLSLYASQQITGAQSGGGDQNDQQQAIAKFTPVIFSGMFLFFPLPAGVLMYMVIANVFQTAQSFILSREPLPENLQKLVEAQEAKAASASGDGREQLAFEPGAAKRATKSASGGTSSSKGKAAKATDADKPGKPGAKKKVSKKKS